MDRRSASSRAALGVAVGRGVVFRATVGAGCARGTPVGRRAKPSSWVAVGVGVGEAVGSGTVVGSEVAGSAAGDDVGPGLAGSAAVPQATSPSTTTDSPADASQLGILLGRLKLKMTERLPINIRPAKNCALYETLLLYGIRCNGWATQCHMA